MRQRVLYLGIDPSRYVRRFDMQLVHHPLIQTIPILKLPQEVLGAVRQASHIISTSPRSASHFLSLCPYNLKNVEVLAIGGATAEKWKEAQIDPVIAKESTQEGMIELLKTMHIPFALYPKSSIARNLLQSFLIQNKVKHLAFDLYTTAFLRPDFLFDLSIFDQIIFTSPSTVDAFFSLYKMAPKSAELIAIGPITKSALVKKTSL